jgi:hypothetical protein
MRNLPPYGVIVYPGQMINDAVEEFRDRTGWGDGVCIYLVDEDGNQIDCPGRDDED